MNAQNSLVMSLCPDCGSPIAVLDHDTPFCFVCGLLDDNEGQQR